MCRTVFILKKDENSSIDVNAYDNYFIVNPGESLCVVRGKLNLLKVDFVFNEGEFSKKHIKRSLKYMPQSFSVHMNCDLKKREFTFTDIGIVPRHPIEPPYLYNTVETSEKYTKSSYKLYNSRLILKITNKSCVVKSSKRFKNHTDLPIVFFSEYSVRLIDIKALSKAKNVNEEDVKELLKENGIKEGVHFAEGTFRPGYSRKDKPPIHIRLYPYSPCTFLPDDIDLLNVKDDYSGPVIRIGEWGHVETIKTIPKHK